MSFADLTYPLHQNHSNASLTASPPNFPLPHPYHSNMMVSSRSFTPDRVDSPTYSFSSRPSHHSFDADTTCYYNNNTLEKTEALSPLRDSFYDASPSNNSPNFTSSGGHVMPLLTPPASESYPTTNSDLINWHSDIKAVDMLCCHPMPNTIMHPLPPPPSTCYSPGCQCQQHYIVMQQQFGIMSPSIFFDPSPYNRGKRHYGKHNNSSRDSLDSTASSSSSTSSSIDSPSNDNQKLALTPRRYKCTLCIKRFTRPSSLATHMHSHTGEKPYKCLVEGCGRRFSVVSNLRRHAKIHSNTP